MVRFWTLDIQLNNWLKSRHLGPPMQDVCVADTNMLVSEKSRRPKANPHRPNAKPHGPNASPT